MSLFSKIFSFSYQNQTYDNFSFLEKIIVMGADKNNKIGYRSIVMQSISSVSIVSKIRTKIVVFSILFGLSNLLSNLWEFGIYNMMFQPTALAITAISLLCIVGAFFIPRKWFLAISTNDGAFNFFPGKRDKLYGVKGELDTALNSQRGHQNFTAIFAEGEVKIHKVHNVNSINAA